LTSLCLDEAIAELRQDALSVLKNHVAAMLLLEAGLLADCKIGASSHLTHRPSALPVAVEQLHLLIALGDRPQGGTKSPVSIAFDL